MFVRDLKPKIQKWLFQNKVIVIYGARQVGKTTLAKELAQETGQNYKYIN
ncbi:MAG: AAA family ATPase, partial [Patescibacteria group bacterium]